jgi:hypothetical protein
MSLLDDSCKFCIAKKGTAQVAEWCVAGSLSEITHCLVQESLFQAPVSLYLERSAKISVHAIQHFLQIANLLLATGQTHLIILENILVLLIGLLPPDHK